MLLDFFNRFYYNPNTDILNFFTHEDFVCVRINFCAPKAFINRKTCSDFRNFTDVFNSALNPMVKIYCKNCIACIEKMKLHENI